MFERSVDAEHVFGHHEDMGRTCVRRRRRLLASLLGVAVVVVLGSPVAAALGRRAEAPSASAAHVSEDVYVVRSGDTLWSIAKRIVRGGDPRTLVDAIADRNGIDPGSLLPGQTLLIPLVTRAA